MHWVMKYRYGISALSCLAFILERHALFIVSKMIAWLPFIFHFRLVHYGAPRCMGGSLPLVVSDLMTLMLARRCLHFPTHVL